MHIKDLVILVVKEDQKASEGPKLLLDTPGRVNLTPKNSTDLFLVRQSGKDSGKAPLTPALKPSGTRVSSSPLNLRSEGIGHSHPHFLKVEISSRYPLTTVAISVRVRTSIIILLKLGDGGGGGESRIHWVSLFCLRPLFLFFL